MTTRTKGALLAGLALAWGALLSVQLMSQPEPKRVPLVHKTGAGQAVSGAPPVTTPRTRTADRESSGFLTPKNIFAPLAVQPEVVVAKPAGPRALPRTKHPGPPEPPPPEQAVAQAAPPPTAEELAMQAARQQLAQYRFLGYLTRQGTRHAFLARGPETYIIRIGEMMDGRVLLTAMDAASVTLVETGTNLKATVPLTQNMEMQNPATPPAPQQEAPPPPPVENSPPPAPPMQTPAGAQIGFRPKS